MNSKKFDLLISAHKHGIKNGFINFWTSVLDEVFIPKNNEFRIFEYGAINYDFLKFMKINYEIREPVGFYFEHDRNDFSIKEDKEEDFIIVPEKDADKFNNFDMGFSYEIFSLTSDIDKLSKRIFNILKEGGCFYSTFSWHSGNPFSKNTKKIRKDKGMPFYNYSLDFIADVFYNNGFEVGLKRINIPYFLIYNPSLCKNRFGSIEGFLLSNHEMNILFSFRKSSGEFNQ